MAAKNFKNLEIWQRGIEIAAKVYHLSKDLNYDFSFRDQMRRSSISISSNIAEGFERDSRKEFARFLNIAKGSAGELQTQLILGNRIGYFNNDELENCEKEIEILIRKIASLRNYVIRNLLPAP